MVASTFSELERIDEQLFDDLVIEVGVGGRFALQVDAYILEHDKVVLYFILDAP